MPDVQGQASPLAPPPPPPPNLLVISIPFGLLRLHCTGTYTTEDVHASGSQHMKTNGYAYGSAIAWLRLTPRMSAAEQL